MHKNKDELIRYWGQQIEKGKKAELILGELSAIFEKMKNDLYNLWLEKNIDEWNSIYYQKKALDKLELYLKRVIDDGKVAEKKIKEVLDGQNE